MECFGNHICNNHAWDNLMKLHVDVPDEEIRRKVKKNWDETAKPLDALGRFEELTAQIGAILGTEHPDILKKAVIIMCADNGIVAENVSQSNQDVTSAVSMQMAKRQSSVGRMAARIGADTIPIDIGINKREQIEGMIQKKVRCGTRNFKIEPAMTEEEVIQAVLTGVEAVSDCKMRGYRILATGEMGIGNTTTSSAAAAALLKCDASVVTGRGAGLDDETLQHKRRIIMEAVHRYGLYDAEPFEILKTVGGLDIAGLVGVCIGGAVYHIPIVLDGMISMVSALLAERMKPGTVRYLIPSHKGKEPAIDMVGQELGLEPVIDGNMALGEGTGAVMMMALLDMALAVYQGTTFRDIQIEQYKRYI